MSKEWDGKTQIERNYLQKTQLIKDCYPEYTKKKKIFEIQQWENKQPALQMGQRHLQTHQRRSIDGK